MNSIYSNWLVDFLPGPLPDETRSTCQDCVMCAAESHISFDQKVKCCSYIPTIPNFLAGKILREEVGVFEPYLVRADVRPQGVYPHNDFVVDYNSRSPSFGRNVDWQCPYYLESEGGKCGIWENRNSRCATWFCKYLRGHISLNFWTAVDNLLTTTEKSLSNWCLHRLEAGSIEFRNAFPAEIQELPFGRWLKQQDFSMQRSPEQMWGKWLGKEREFFYECDSEVTPLDWNDVRQICGPGIETLEENTLEAYEAIQSNVFPEVLRISSFHQTDKNDQEVWVWKDTLYDPVNVSKTALRLLHRMNGLNMEEVLLHLPKELLQKLFDAGVII